jgi:hypothetical protein
VAGRGEVSNATHCNPIKQQRIHLSAYKNMSKRHKLQKDQDFTR